MADDVGDVFTCKVFANCFIVAIEILLLSDRIRYFYYHQL